MFIKHQASASYLQCAQSKQNNFIDRNKCKQTNEKKNMWFSLHSIQYLFNFLFFRFIVR